MRSNVDPIASEARAVERGRHCFLQDDGTFRVLSHSRPNLRHTVSLEAVARGERWLVRCRCSCESGSASPSGGPYGHVCWHGSLVGRRLERDGWARWESGSWWLTDRGLDIVRALDPAAGLEPPTLRARGRCSECQTFLAIRYRPGQDPKDVAAEHDPKCAAARAHRKANPGPDVDLWQR